MTWIKNNAGIQLFNTFFPKGLQFILNTFAWKQITTTKKKLHNINVFNYLLYHQAFCNSVPYRFLCLDFCTEISELREYDQSCMGDLHQFTVTDYVQPATQHHSQKGILKIVCQ